MIEYNIPEFTIKEITPEEYKKELQDELTKYGLVQTLKFRCDEIAEEINLLNLSYATKSFIFERLNEIIEISELVGDADANRKVGG